MLQNKRIFSLLLVIALISFSSWGFLVHRTINQISIYNLPEPLRSFFHKDKANLVYNSVRPDIRRNTDKTEGSKHYIDLEKFGPNAANNMPMDWATAVKKYSEDTLKEYGWGPYNAMMQLDKLTKAFKSGNADSIYFYAADLAHYIGDLHVPLHTTDNHDGQLTGQKGMHALWESTIPELTIQQYMLYNNHKATYIKDPAAAFLGLARGDCCLDFNFSLKSLKAFFVIITSPRISICCIPFAASAICKGMDLICLMLLVMSSPSTPSPLVHARTKRSFSYINEILAPSNFGSTQ